jgi:cysteine desulfurase / selenocysteine lyase
MANEFFTSAAQVAQGIAVAPGAHVVLPSSAIPGAAFPSASVPTEKALQAGAATPFRVPAPPPLPATSHFALPETPGGVSAADFAANSSFGFLDEIRPLFSYPVASPLPVVPALPNVAIPGEIELRAIANSFSSAATPQLLESIQHVSTPHSAGSGTQVRPLAADHSYRFLEELRPLVPVRTLPVRDEQVRLQDQTPAGLSLSSRSFEVEAIRRDFPIMQERVHGKPLVWLDNAATTQKPQSVIDRLSKFYAHENSNIHRAAHELAACASDAYEAARDKVRRFINAGSVKEIIFVRGTTEGINLVAQSWGRQKHP